MQQATLFDIDKKSKVILHVPISTLSLSEYNPRKSRSDEYVTRLSDRIKANGYEITRAMWVYRNGDGYKVFAGGTRLQAATMAGVDQVPVVLHIGYADADYVRLADQDNEDDEYHAPVGLVDTWMSYKALADTGWTQERIAGAKGCSQTYASLRLRCAEFPESVLEIITTHSINEGQARELLDLLHCNNFTPWLTQETALLHVIEQSMHKPIAKTFKAEVEKLNEAIALVNNAGVTDRLLRRLNKSEAITAYEVQVEIDKLTVVIAREAKHKADEAQRIADEARQVELEAIRAKAEAEHRLLIESMSVGQWWKLGSHYLYCGDTSLPEFYENLPDAALVFADPPYNASAAEWDNDFHWGHDWAIDKAPMVAVTPGIASIFDFAKITEMPYKWGVSCWIKNGMTRGALGFGNWIYTALFSNAESIHRQEQDFFSVTIATSETSETSHKGRKPSQYMDKTIEMFSRVGDWVVDPFAGSGSTLFSCEQKKRRCVCGEIEPQFCKEIVMRWEALTGGRASLYENAIQ